MTVLEALKATRADLAKVNVRVDEIQEIGLPIHNAVQNIGAIIEVMEKAEEEQKARQATEQEQEETAE